MSIYSFENRLDCDASTGPFFPVKEGQEVLVVDNRGRAIWDLSACLVSRGVVQSVKRTYVYVGNSMTDRHPVRYNKFSLIEARSDGYSPNKALFESEEAFQRAMDYDQTWDRLLSYFKDGRRRSGRYHPVSYETLKEIERLIGEEN